MSVEEIVGSLKAHEERLQGQVDSNRGQQLLLTEEEWMKREKNEAKLLLTREEWLKRKGKGGDSENRNRGNRDRSRVRCFNCLGYGHFAAECRKSRRDNREQRLEANLTRAQDEEPALLMAQCGSGPNALLLLNRGENSSENDSKQQENKVWYLDNGASNHMTGHRAKFVELDETVGGQVKFGDGSMVSIKGKGFINITCKNGERRTLNEVYFIPTLRSNIISLGQLSEEGNKVILDGEYLWVYNLYGKLLIKVKRASNRLYKIIIEEDEAICLLTKAEETMWLWHRRLGHTNFQAITMLSKKKWRVVCHLFKYQKGYVMVVSCLSSLASRSLRNLILPQKLHWSHPY